MTQTQWLPGVIVLAIGLAIGFAFLVRFRRGGGRPNRDAGDRLADLERRAQLALDQLKELEADRHHLEPSQFETEKNRLELEAAGALRARDEYARDLAASSKGTPRPEPTGPSTVSAGWFGRHPQLKGALWGGGVVLFFVALGLLLGREQKPRQEGAGAIGRTPPMAGTAEQQEDPGLNEALANYQAHPESIDAMSRLAHELINRQDFEEASRLTERALGMDPFHLESRIHRVVLAAIQGNRERGEKALEHLANAYPNAYEGRLYLGLLALQSGEHRVALDNFERYAAEAPPNEQPPRLTEGIAMLRRQLGLTGGDR
jgi:tetratricopeptide (TPR) repeat protein